MAGSDQWTSSISTRTGATAASRRSTPTRASNSRAWSQACWSGAPDTPGSSAGTSRARSAPDAPTTTSRRSGSSSRTSWPRISTIGPYGRPSSPTFAQAPRRTSTPRASAAPRQLGRQPALADAGLAGDQQVRGRPLDGGIERGERGVQLGPASDRDGADEASGHAGDHTEGGYPCRMGQRTTIASVIPPRPPRPRRGERRPRRPRCARPRRACPGCSTRGRPPCSR